jgi:hypothetical protein
MASSARHTGCGSRARTTACLGAAAVCLACAEDGDEPLESLTRYSLPALEQLQLSACEEAELERALQENAEEIAQAQAESRALGEQLAAKVNLHLTTATGAATRDGVAIPGGPARPDPIAKVVDGNAYFWRPDVGRRYYVVLAAEVPSAYFYAALLAAHALEGALADDCLTDVFTVMRQEEHAALHPALRQRSSVIELGYSELACLNLAAGCSNSPRLEEMDVGHGRLERRMRLGSYIGLETDYDTSRDHDDAPDLVPERARNVLLHELSHILGFEHPRYTELEPELDRRNLRVPRSSQGTVPSFLFTTADPLFSPLPSAEDRRVLALLYAGDCEYRAEYRLLGEVCSDDAEWRCQLHGGSCEVTRGAGADRLERCRWHNFRDEASCLRYSAGSWEVDGGSDPSTVFAGEAGACLASELPSCVNESFVATELDLAGHCCTLFGTDAPGLLFEAFSSEGVSHYFCSHQQGVGRAPDVLEFSAPSELEQLALLDAAGGGPAAGWQVDLGDLLQAEALPANVALSRERMRSGCVMTRVTTDALGESGIVFNYRSSSDYYVFDAIPNVRRRIRQVVDGVSQELSVEPWSAPRGWASAVELAVCYGDGIHTFIDGRLSSRVSVDQHVSFFGAGGRVGLWNERNVGARHAYLRAHSLVEGYALLRGPAGG